MIFKVNGTKHHSFNFPTEKESVFIIKEPNNEFDSNAVGIYNVYNQKIGYVPRFNSQNVKVLGLLNSGKAILSNVVLANEEHGYILVEAQIIEKPVKEYGSRFKFLMN